MVNYGVSDTVWEGIAKMAQAQANWQSLLQDQEQWSDGSDLYVLESDDDPYAFYEMVTSDSELETEDDMHELVSDDSSDGLADDFQNLMNSENKQNDNIASNVTNEKPYR